MKFFTFKTIFACKIHLVALGLLLVFTFNSKCYALNGQPTSMTISLSGPELTLERAIKQIEEKTEFRFVYSASKIPLKSKVELKQRTARLDVILENILKPLGISYAVKNDKIILTPSGQILKSTRGEGSVTGIVRDNNGEPLMYATIVIPELNNLGTVAGSNGRFSLSKIPTGTYSISASFLGYQPQTRKIEVTAKSTVTVRFELSAMGTKLKEVVKYGNLTRGQAKALNQQKNAPNIKNIVSSDQFKKFPDRNAAEAVARIPSVSVDYDQGEGENVQIRGLSPEYNSLTINGQRIPSPDPDDGSRGVGLDLLNHDLIESIEVSKAITPDMDADAIGGAINFKMKQAPDSTLLMLEAGAGYNPQHSDFTTYGKDIMNFSGFWGDRFMNKKVGFMLGGSYYRTNRGSVLREYEYADEDEIYDEEIFAQHTNDYDVKRQRVGIIANTDYRFNETNKLYFNANYNIYLDDEIRRSVDYNIDSGRERRETRNRREDQQLINLTLGGENRIENIEIDYMASWIKASEEMPDRTYWRFQRDVDFSQFTNDEVKNFDGKTNIQGDERLELARLRWNNNTKEDEDLSGRFNINIPFNFFNAKSYFKTGGKYLNKNVSYRPNRYTLTDFSNPLFIDGGEFGQIDVRITDVDTATYGASKHVDQESYREESYEATEIISAAYGMFILNFGPKVSLLTGIRLENTQNKYRSLFISEANQNNSEEKSSYTNILPSAHLTLKPLDKTNIRLAYSTGIARPAYSSLIPVEIERDESNNILPITKGNPDLKPTRSNNFDIMVERYTNYLGLFSLGVFHKRLSDIITSRTFREPGTAELTREVTMPENREDATVTGLEVAFNQRLHFIEMPVLKDITIYGNYTFTDTRYEVDGRELPLSASPRNVYNLALMYDNAQNGWSFVISNNYRDAILISEGENKYRDVYFDSEYHLDISVGKQLGQNFTVLLQLNNLTDQEEHEVLGDPAKDYARVLQWEKYNSYGTITLRYKL